MRVPRAATTGLALAAMAGLGACVNELNNDNRLEGVSLDTINEPIPGDSDTMTPLVSDKPSVTGLARQNWATTQVFVPVAGVDHRPHYTQHAPRYALETARQRGEHPTEWSIFETGSHEGNLDQISEAIAAPVHAALSILIMPFRAIHVAPWATVHGPDKSFSRTPVDKRLPDISEPAPPSQPTNVAPAVPKPGDPDAAPGKPANLNDPTKPAAPENNPPPPPQATPPQTKP